MTLETSGIKNQINICLGQLEGKAYLRGRKEIEDYFQENCDLARKEGYEDGYKKGREDGYKTGLHEVEGYHLGYQKGYEDGLKEKEATEKHWGKKLEIHYIHTDEEIADSFIKDISAVKELLPKQTDEIRIGDEVIYQIKSYDPHNGDKGVVIGVNNDWREVWFISRWSSVGVLKDCLTKTGRHFPQITEVLKQMQEDKE